MAFLEREEENVVNKDGHRGSDTCFFCSPQKNLQHKSGPWLTYSRARAVCTSAGQCSLTVTGESSVLYPGYYWSCPSHFAQPKNTEELNVLLQGLNVLYLKWEIEKVDSNCNIKSEKNFLKPLFLLRVEVRDTEILHHCIIKLNRLISVYFCQQH